MTEGHGQSAYESVAADCPLRQADIFVDMPQLSTEFGSTTYVLQNGDTRELVWSEAVALGQVISVVAPVQPVVAIVMTPDCDCLRGPSITLSRIDALEAVNHAFTNAVGDTSFLKILHQQCIENLKWFYLPPDPTVGFDRKMAADLRQCFCVPRESLEQARHLRRGRLGLVAAEHFRERLAEFFRRYPYDEWYPLTKAEFELYVEKSGHPDAEPYPWQL